MRSDMTKACIDIGQRSEKPFCDYMPNKVNHSFNALLKVNSAKYRSFF